MMRVLIKGAGDLATGIACRLHAAGFSVMMTEIAQPTTIRKTVAFSQAVYDHTTCVEGIEGILVTCADELEAALQERKIPVWVDPDLKQREIYRADVEVDAILAKRNTGTTMKDAKLVIGVGPGFTAGIDCHAVIESKRGHFLGRVIAEGSAIPNTAVPGDIEGYSIQRLVRATAEGIFHPIAKIGDFVVAGQIVAYCDQVPVYAQMDGMVRGILQEGLPVYLDMKCGDIDPRCDKKLIDTVSDKARAIGGGVLEVIVANMMNQKY